MSDSSSSAAAAMEAVFAAGSAASAASLMASLSLSSTASFPIPHLFAAQVSYPHPNTTTQLVTVFLTSSDSHPTGLPPTPGPVINLISSSSESNSPSGSPVVISSSSSSDGQQPSPPPNRLQSPLSSEPVLPPPPPPAQQSSEPVLPPPPPPAQQSSEPVLPRPPTCGACRALSKRKCNMSCEYRAFYPPEDMSSFAYLMEYFSPECVLRFLKAGPVEEVAARKRNLRKTAQMLNDDPANSASDQIDMLQQKLAAANETIQRLAVAAVAVASRND